MDDLIIIFFREFVPMRLSTKVRRDPELYRTLSHLHLIFHNFFLVEKGDSHYLIKENLLNVI
jgi:hypothetical protein